MTAREVASPDIPAVMRYYSTYDWKGFRINYVVQGPEHAQPVLLVHGFGASINHWRKNVPALLDTNQLKVYCIDLIGFGGSSKASPEDVTYSLELWRDLLIDFAYHFEPNARWSFVGNSIGSLVSLMAAKELGEGRVRCCSLMNSAGGMVSFREEELSPVARAAVTAFNSFFFNKIVGPYLFRQLRQAKNLKSVLQQIYVNQDAVTEELVDIIGTPAFDEGACDVFLAVLNGKAGPAPEELLQELHWCPILVMWGENDQLTPFRTGFHPGVKFYEHHPTITIHGIPDCGHCPHDDRPEEVHKFLVPFLLKPYKETSLT